MKIEQDQATAIAMDSAIPLPAGMMRDMAAYDGGKYAALAFTPEEANRIAALLRAACKFEVKTEQIGDSCYGPRGWRVELWSTNRSAGNRNLFLVPLETEINEKRAKQIAKEAKDKFSGRDNEALHRQAVPRGVQSLGRRRP